MHSRLRYLAALSMATLTLTLAAPGTALAAVTPPSGSATPGASAVHLPPGIAWQQGDVSAAFAFAKASNRPLLLYWGAVWCPPCNQVKATIFSQQAFKDRSSFFVPVYLDGDGENAQKIGERYKVRGYPTMILFRPDGTEITRLPGEADPDRYMRALSLGLNATHPFRQTFASALKSGATLSRDEWRMLANYSWDTDGDPPVAQDRIADALQTLAAHARADRAEAESRRLELTALSVVAAADPKQNGTLDRTTALALLHRVLQDPKLARETFDILVEHPVEITTLLTERGTPARRDLAKQWDVALARLAADTSLSTTDRLSALDGRVGLARLDTPKPAPLAPALLDDVRRQVAAADKATTNVYERQSVISEGADTLTDAGLIDASDVLLKSSLARSPAPYYFMSGLAANAKARGDKAAALDWYRRAYDASSGPATRLRWGASYFSGLIALAPDDEARIRSIAGSLVDEAGQTSGALYGSNRRALTKIVAQLAQWNKGGAHDATVKAIAKQFDGMCNRLPAGDDALATCESLIRPVKA